MRVACVENDPKYGYHEDSRGFVAAHALRDRYKAAVRECHRAERAVRECKNLEQRAAAEKELRLCKAHVKIVEREMLEMSRE